MHTVAHFMCEWIFAPFCSRFGKGDGDGDGEVLGGTESVQSHLPPPEEETRTDPRCNPMRVFRIRIRWVLPNSCPSTGLHQTLCAAVSRMFYGRGVCD